jgi:hypothetical protein
MLNENNILRNNIKDFRLLTEWVSRYDVIDAINDHDIVYIYYSGDETVNRGFRTIEPFVLGKSTADNLVVRAWQRAGSTDTGRKVPVKEKDEMPGWRLFRLDGITTFMKTMKKFKVDPDHMKSKRLKYKKEDGGMKEIILAIDPDEVVDVNLDKAGKIDSLRQKLELSDPQSAKFSSFYSAGENSEMLLKKSVGDIYNYIKLQQKDDPIKYIVTKKGNRIWYDTVENENKYNDKENLGNLNTLFRELYNIKGFKINKAFIEKQRQEFMDNVKKHVNK